MNEKIYKISTPPFQQDELFKLGTTLLSNPEVQNALNKANDNYLHWEELKYKDWIPEKLLPNKELFWTLIKFVRGIGLKPNSTPIRDVSGYYFKMNINNYSQFLHIIDKEMAGNFMGISDLSEKNKQEFITRNIIEESIASSQLEGANTSRTVARQMLLEGRNPNTHSELMIVNNHKTMLKIEQELYKEDLSWELICELHRMITHKTIPEEKQGVLRETLDSDGNRLVIKPWDDTTIAYIAPDKTFVETELPRLINFANDKETNNALFIHPLIKAIMLHFWIGLLHPFEDGNGRLARILFYWYMLKNEYWTFAYLSLSEEIKKSPIQYAMAYIYSEQDDYDLTYFIYYNINKLKLARKDFQDYIRNKTNENRVIASLSQNKYNFNDRQIKLLQHLNKKTENRTNITAYQQLFSIKKVTAINDLKELVKKGFLVKNRKGRNIYYYPTKEVKKIFKS